MLHVPPQACLRCVRMEAWAARVILTGTGELYLHGTTLSSHHHEALPVLEVQKCLH